MLGLLHLFPIFCCDVWADIKLYLSLLGKQLVIPSPNWNSVFFLLPRCLFLRMGKCQALVSCLPPSSHPWLSQWCLQQRQCSQLSSLPSQSRLSHTCRSPTSRWAALAVSRPTQMLSYMFFPNVCGLSWSRNVSMTRTQLAMRLALLGESSRAYPFPVSSIIQA